MENSEKLIRYVLLAQQYKHKALQGSAEWKAARPRNIGGSEIATCAALNEYSDICELIKMKVGLATFNGNINTMWGNILEELSKMLTVALGGGDEEIGIMEPASFPGLVPHHWYSPDGILYRPIRDLLILLEYKNAARRRANGTVPSGYMPQVFCGLDALASVDYAMFIDTTFRRCSSRSFGPRDYSFDWQVHGRPRGGDLPIPTHICMVGFYGAASAAYAGEPRIEGFGAGAQRAAIEGLLDMGACSVDTLEAVFEQVVGRKTLKCWYAQPLPLAEFKTVSFEESVSITAANPTTIRAADLQDMIRVFVKECGGEGLVGVMPLKVFGVHMSRVDRDGWKKWTRRAAARASPKKTGDPHYVPPDLDADTFTEAYAATIRNITNTTHALLDLPFESRGSALNAIYDIADEGAGDEVECDADMPVLDADELEGLA